MTNLPALKDITIGIWGSRRAGKTTFLVQLFDQLKKSNDWEVKADTKASEFISNCRRYLNHGEFPPATEIADEYNLYTYTLRPTIYNNLIYNKKKEVIINLKFVDAPGDWYEEFEDEQQQLATIQVGSQPQNPVPTNNNGISDVVKYLHSCNGVIYLLDPFYDKNANKGDVYEELLGKLFDRINNYDNDNLLRRRTHEQYVVFAVTKADNKDIFSDTLNFNNVVNLVRKKLNHQCNQPEQVPITWFMNFFTLDKLTFETQISSGRYLHANTKHRCQFFAISSIGVYLNSQLNSYESPVKEENKPPENNENNTNKQINQNNLGLGVASNIQPPLSLSPPSFPFSPTSGQQAQEKIDTGVVSRPFNVVESLQWIIQGIILERGQ